MMTRKLGVAVAAVLIGTFAGGCGSDSGGGGGTVDALAKILEDGAKESGEQVTSAQAKCLAEVYVDLIGEDAAKEVISAGPDGADAAVEEAMADVDMEKALASIDKLSKCMPDMFEGLDEVDLGDLEEEPAEG